MDNVKTGIFIRELRKEKGMTQKDVAVRLNITDRAVSKWERGLCAPDISLLEPLAQCLECSVLELIAGEKEAHAADSLEKVEGVKSVIDYSVSELTHKISLIRKKYLLFAVGGILFLFLIPAFFLWRGGYFFVVDKSVSPDGSKRIVVYDKLLDGGGFSMADGISMIVELGNQATLRVTYGDCDYQGVWWAPDDEKYVIALGYGGDTQLALAWLERSVESNLSAYLTMGVEATELSKYGYIEKDGWPKIRYQFLQWAADSASMLIHYSFEDTNLELHSGYFWYNCMEGSVSAVLELEPSPDKK